MGRALHIAVGVLRRDDGQVLIAQRRPGKPGAGQWEFPGGKRDPGETLRQALDRELHEELGIVVQAVTPLIRLRHRYPDRQVLLDTWLVEVWHGDPVGREGQPVQWSPVSALDTVGLLAADAPIVQALQLPTCYAISPPDLPTTHWAAWAQGTQAELCRFRATDLDDAQYWAAWAAAEQTACTPAQHWVADRLPSPGFRSERLSAVHLSHHRFAALTGQLPSGRRWRLGVSCHGPAELRRAKAGGADFAVLGPVCPTASHPGAPPLGWARWSQWADQASLPVYAIGGVTPDDVPRVRAAGGQGIAAISAFLAAS